MKVSIITPTHNAKWLGEAYASLQRQTYSDWEWIVLPNGGAKDLPDFSGEPRVRVIPVEGKLNIGGYKQRGFSEATGELLVELDHDDELAPFCLAELVDACRTEGPGFYYSDFCNFFDDGRGQSETYPNLHGWEDYEVEFRDATHRAIRAFSPSARALCDIWFAPNHVRAWHREAYFYTGGHDPNLTAADDHDLVCRTYLSPHPFVYIPKCLYYYRRIVDPRTANTFTDQQFSDDVKRRNDIHRNTYLHRLAQRWAERMALPCLDFGGAHNCPAGYTSVDVRDADVLHEIGSGPLPFEDDSVGIVRAQDFFEHVPRNRFVYVMNEIYRVLAPGGWILSSTPSSDGRGAFQDPTHVNYMNENSFWYYTQRAFAKYVPEFTGRFQGVRLFTYHPTQWHRDRQIPYVYADLVALKGQRQPGPVGI